MESTIRAPGPAVNSSSLLRCSWCRTQQKKDTKNLVICIDDASNEITSGNTNVSKLFTKINLESTNPEQYALYMVGFGSRSMNPFGRIKEVVSDGPGTAAARNKNVKDAYGWLAEKYKEGDQIYLFGFSQGAYQVRMLAAMIHEVGLIRTPTEDSIKKAYDHYDSSHSGGSRTGQFARDFKKTFSWPDARVHFIGVWDTVSSLRFIREDSCLSGWSCAEHACYFRHALALDELRVKFMPEYFHEINALARRKKCKPIDTPPDDRKVLGFASERGESTLQKDIGSDLSASKKGACDIKEVWFAGNHSDVGGENKTGRYHHAGNVPLLWMRREAAANGLMLTPTDIVWLPEDLDFGTTNSAARTPRATEFMSSRHPVTLRGSSEVARRWRRQQPRRIIPGQKVHASVLYAHAYKPKAMLGEGLDIPIIQPGLEDTMPDGELWETGLFDDTAAEELMASLSSPQGVAPIYLDRLLFMLRFKEGRQCVKNVSGWQDIFLKLMTDHDCATVVRLVAIVAYHEASCDLGPHLNCCMPRPTGISEDILIDAERCLNDILVHHKQRDGNRVVALLRLLTKHRMLRERILTEEMLETLGNLLDAIVGQPERYFVLAMDGLNCLLQCVDTQKIVVKKLGSYPPDSDVSRLSRIMEVDDLRLLTAALRMVLILVRIPEGRGVCSEIKSRIMKLARKDEQLVGPLAVEISLVLNDPNDRDQLNIRDSHIQVNLARALAHFNRDRLDPDGQSPTVNSAQQILFNLLGLGATVTELTEQHRKLVGELKAAAEKGNDRERTAATMTLLKLCETEIIRDHLCEIRLLDVFVSQLRRKDSALLAAYALANCLECGKMEESIKDNAELPENIVNMLKLDYFDDAVERVEGFQIFGDLMKCGDLREKINGRNITEILTVKLGKGKANEIRTSLICLDIFRSLNSDAAWTHELVAEGLEFLKHPAWKAQKAGVMILSALSQTEHGVAAIGPHINEIVEMLLPNSYLVIRPSPQGTPHSPMSPTEHEVSRKSTSTPRSSSWMMGPAYALHILAQNKILRDRTRLTIQYGYLKDLHLSGALVDRKDTPAWRLGAPKRTDVINMLNRMIKTVDDEPLGEDLMSTDSDDVILPPHIHHWNRLVTRLRSRPAAAVTVLPPLLGVSLLSILAVVVSPPVNASVQVYGFLKRVLSRQDDRSPDRPVTYAKKSETGSATAEVKGISGDAKDGRSSGHSNDSSQVVETRLSQDQTSSEQSDGTTSQDVGPQGEAMLQSSESTQSGLRHGETGPATCEEDSECAPDDAKTCSSGHVSESHQLVNETRMAQNVPNEKDGHAEGLGEDMLADH